VTGQIEILEAVVIVFVIPTKPMQIKITRMPITLENKSTQDSEKVVAKSTIWRNIQCIHVGILNVMKQQKLISSIGDGMTSVQSRRTIWNWQRADSHSSKSTEDVGNPDWLRRYLRKIGWNRRYWCLKKTLTMKMIRRAMGRSGHFQNCVPNATHRSFATGYGSSAT
jgi:hypothetical protein